MKKLIGMLLLIVILVTLFGFREPLLQVFSWFGSREAIATSMEHAGLWGPVALFILFVLQVFLAFIPGQALMIACGYLYGFWGGFLISWLSLVIGGEIAYVLARSYGRPFAERWIAPAVLVRWNQAAAGQGITFFALSLVMPLVPNDAMCYVAGLGTISRIRFSIANVVGRGMACLITSAAGAFGGDLSWQAWAILIAIFVTIGIAWYIGKHNWAQLLTVQFDPMLFKKLSISYHPVIRKSAVQKSNYDVPENCCAEKEKPVMSQSSFTSLIVTYNSANEISNLLNDVHVCMADNKIIVIDNASKDETVNVVEQNFPQVRLIRNSANVGYAKAVNQGFEFCDTEYVLLLNPDIRINSPQLFAEMEMCLKQSRRIAAVAPLQFKNDDGKQYLNFTWSYSTLEAFKVYLSFRLQRKEVFPKPIQVPFLNAGCLLIRRSAFEQVGRLNEKYFLYGEEPDLFLKFRRYGFECYLLPDVAVTHYRERSLMTRPAFQRVRIRFLAAWNVTDALINGWANILLDKLVIKRIPSVTRKRRTTYKKRMFNNWASK